MDKSKHIIISLGGSIIVPNNIDTSFILNFVNLIKEYVNKGFKFVIITGGGYTARNYIKASQGIGEVSDVDLDWIGIASTRINAELLRVAFGDTSHNAIIMDPDNIPDTDKNIIVGGGWKPGNSSDLAAVRVAYNLNSKKVINLSNIDYVYNTDPKNDPNAVIIESTNWSDFRKVLPGSWDPGLSSPFDPIAAKEAESFGIEVVIMNGNNLSNLESYLKGEQFIGTVIR